MQGQNIGVSVRRQITAVSSGEKNGNPKSIPGVVQYYHWNQSMWLVEFISHFAESNGDLSDFARV